MTTRSRLGVVAGVGLIVVAAVLFYELSPSPSATARVTLDGATVEVRYSAPSVRGRQIFGEGGLLSNDPTYPVWRAGANAATTLITTADLDVGGLTVPAGSYSLYVLVRNPEAWELIVNRQTGQWGRGYDAGQDLGRIPMTMSTPSVPVETLAYVLTSDGRGVGLLRLEWERYAGTVRFTAR